jgi:hypothetical protein
LPVKKSRERCAHGFEGLRERVVSNKNRGLAPAASVLLRELFTGEQAQYAKADQRNR